MFVCEVNEEFEWVDGDEFHASERHTPSTDLLVTYLPYRLRWRTHNHHQTAMYDIRAEPCHPRAGGNALDSTGQALPQEHPW